jgi:hypothetical protein
VFSYAMNNFWGTNYKAGQDGLATFRYALVPHARFDAVRAYQAGLEATHPLVVRATAASTATTTRKSRAPLRAPFILRNRGIIVSAMKPSDDGRGLIVRLFNAGERTERPVLQWPRPSSAAASASKASAAAQRRRGQQLDASSASKRSPMAQRVPAISLVDRDDRPTRRIATLPRLPPFGLLTVYLDAP